MKISCKIECLKGINNPTRESRAELYAGRPGIADAPDFLRKSARLFSYTRGDPGLRMHPTFFESRPVYFSYTGGYPGLRMHPTFFESRPAKAGLAALAAAGLAALAAAGLVAFATTPSGLPGRGFEPSAYAKAPADK
jgi:hypothetical protein